MSKNVKTPLIKVTSKYLLISLNRLQNDNGKSHFKVIRLIIMKMIELTCQDLICSNQMMLKLSVL